MAFYVGDMDEGGGAKQHLNLSRNAWEIVDNDMFSFGVEKRSEFINIIFDHYAPNAEASIAKTLDEERDNLSKLLSDISGSEKITDRVIKKIVEQKKANLMEKVGSYGKGFPIKFWLNKKNLSYLTKDERCKEDAYYSNRGKYIKCVIEEYTRLPYIEREKVFYKPFMDTIEKEIKKEPNERNQLLIKTGVGNIYSVYPYGVYCDPLSMYNYLVGYRRWREEDDLQPCSFKISALKEVKGTGRSAFLKKAKREELEKMVAARGVQFMPGNETEVRVKLSEKGIRDFQRNAHLRPKLAEQSDDNVFVFQCTETQAQFYFFKFGKDAEILAPIELRQKVKAMYEEAAKLYKEERGKVDE